MQLIQIITMLFGVFALTRVYLRFKKHKSPLAEAFFWAAMWFVLIIIAFFPNLTTVLAKLLGIQSGTGLVVYLSIILLFYICFRLYAKIYSMEREITDLVRSVAVSRPKVLEKHSRHLSVHHEKPMNRYLKKEDFDSNESRGFAYPASNKKKQG